MSHQQRSPEAQLPADIQRVADEIGGLHRQGRVDAQAVPDEVRAVIPRRQQDVFRPALPPLAQLHADGIHQRLLAHGFHDPRGAQDRNTSRDAQPGVERPFRKGLPRRYRDDYLQSLPAVGQGPDLLYRFQDHPPGHAVDGRRPYRLVQPRLGHPAYPDAAVDGNSGCLVTGHLREDQRPPGHIRVVSAVLLDGAGHGVRPHRYLLDLQLQPDALGRCQCHPLHPPSGEQHVRRRLRRCRRAGTGGIPQAELLPALDDVFLHHLSIW